MQAVTISEETGSEALATEALLKTLEKLGSVKSEKGLFVACDLAHEIAIANKANIVTIRMRPGTNRASTTRKPDEKPVLEIDKLSDYSMCFNSRPRSRTRPEARVSPPVAEAPG